MCLDDGEPVPNHNSTRALSASPGQALPAPSHLILMQDRESHFTVRTRESLRLNNLLEAAQQVRVRVTPERSFEALGPVGGERIPGEPHAQSWGVHSGKGKATPFRTSCSGD